MTDRLFIDRVLALVLRRSRVGSKNNNIEGFGEALVYFGPLTLYLRLAAGPSRLAFLVDAQFLRHQKQLSQRRCLHFAV